MAIGGTDQRPSAGVLIIGNEILSGGVEEQNAAFFIKRFRALGTRTREVAFVEDTAEAVAAAVRRMSAAYDVVVTSGGVGPTHDDVTMEGVALAFGVPLVASEERMRIIEGLLRDKTLPGHLRMARVPEGAEAVYGASMPWPTTLMRNVYIFPGVPWLLRSKFQDLEARFATPWRMVVGSFELLADEAEIVDVLDVVVAAHPGVEIGSYPRYEGKRWRLRLTFEATDAAVVDAAMEAARGPLSAFIESESGPG